MTPAALFTIAGILAVGISLTVGGIVGYVYGQNQTEPEIYSVEPMPAEAFGHMPGQMGPPGQIEPPDLFEDGIDFDDPGAMGPPGFSPIAQCGSCGRLFEPNDQHLTCPHCGYAP